MEELGSRAFVLIWITGLIVSAPFKSAAFWGIMGAGHVTTMLRKAGIPLLFCNFVPLASWGFP